ncbi:MAG: HD-GYP domain-containing protein [Dehalococcoidia bacterium]|nr:HD-GYP domain-containing protein [Dehalococcoidia bacterium]
MRRALPSVLSWAMLVVASTTLFAVLRLREAGAGDAWAWNSPAGHFWIVSAASLVCVGLALVAGVAAARARSARVMAIALAFIAMAGIFAVHGLATPGFIVDAPSRTPPVAASEAAPYSDHYADAYGPVTAGTTGGSTPSPFYNVTGLSSRLALLVSAAFLALAAAPWSRRFEAWAERRRVLVLAATVAVVATYGVLALAAPWLVPTQLTASATFPWASTGLVLALGGYAAWRFGSTYHQSGLGMHGAVAVGAVLMVQAQLSMHFGANWTGTFWLYHVQLLAGFLAIFWGLLVEFSHGRTVRSLEALTVSDVLEQLRSGYTEPIVALSAALEARDGYTLGHGERVAALAVLIGQRMGVSGRRLRGIAAGGLLHDVGKIGVPDAVLHKHGALTPAEYDVVKEHPARGAEMLRHHFDQKVEAHVIRHHHERWDGGGYPDGLVGEAIPLEARIAAVADVYDALRSNRAYRPAFARDKAIQVLREGAGAHFDPRCVEAFLGVVDQWEQRFAADTLAYVERRLEPRAA